MTHAKIVAPSTSEAMATTSSNSDKLLANIGSHRYSIFQTAQASDIVELDATQRKLDHHITGCVTGVWTLGETLLLSDVLI